MQQSVKKKTVSGILWSGIEKIAYELIQFIVGIVLARILTPHDYGTVGLITVFITISTLFIDGGLTTALIQKKNRTATDFNTVFLFNLGMSVGFYCIIFLCAPFVANFYHIEELTSLLRILSIVLLITPFSSIQITQLTINVDFKSLSIVSVPSAIVSGIIGILMAHLGYGPYALVAQQVIMILMRTLLVNFISKYHIKLEFSKDSFKDLFSFSYKLVLSSSLDRIYTSLFTMIVGKKFSPCVLGCYTRGTQFVSMASGILGDVFNRVTFPIMSSVQDEIERLKNIFRKYIQVSSFVIFGVLFCLLLIAKPLVLILLTDKWIDAVPIMQIMCLAYLTNHISNINRNLLYTKKRSDLALKLEVIKKTIAFSIFIASIPFGIIVVCWGQVVYNIIATLLNSFYTKRLIGITLVQQLIDYGKFLIIAFVSMIIPYFVMGYISKELYQILLAGALYFIIYLLLNALLSTYPYMELKKGLYTFIHKKGNK